MIFHAHAFTSMYMYMSECLHAGKQRLLSSYTVFLVSLCPQLCTKGRGEDQKWGLKGRRIGKNKSDEDYFSTSGEADFNASNLTGVLADDDRSLNMSVMVVNDIIDEDDEFFAILLELVSAENPDRVDLSDRNISLLRIIDDDGECECSELI